MADSDVSDSRASTPVSKDNAMETSSSKRVFLMKVFPKVALIFLGYVISYMDFSLVVLLLTAATLVWIENHEISKTEKIKTKATACSFTKHDLIKRIDEIPSWVKFPDRERAEWLNQVIAQLWPTVHGYIVKLFRTSIQNKIRKKHESFRFESIDFGSTPPKIDGIKVYNSATTKDSIIIDFDVFYDGNCDINFSLSGTGIGGISDFQLSVEVRVVLKPLLLKMPLIGGIQVYFLNTPDINFNIDGLSSIPGLSSLIRTKIQEKITKVIVFPNKITKRFSKSVEPSELKALEPAGVLRVHIFEAKDLMGKDITGKSDPYVIMYLGAQEWRTHVINQSLNPKWDYWCEFVVLDPMAQHIGFKLFDRDNVNEDDFLGSGDIDISSVLRGDTDQWLTLENAKHGSLHLRFTWLSLSSDISVLNAISEETKLLQVEGVSTAILLVYVDMAHKLPEAKHFVKPHPFFFMSVGSRKQKSKVKKHTVDPAWEQGFVFLVPNPNMDTLHMTIFDKQSNTLLTQFSYKIANLLNEPNLQISKKEFPLENENSKVVLSLQLKILSNEQTLFESDASDSDSEASSLSRNSSLSKRSLRSSLKKETVEEIVNSTTVSPSALSPASFKRSPSTNSAGEHRLGRLELSLEYSEPRQKLLVTIHQLSDILGVEHVFPKDLSNPERQLRKTTSFVNAQWAELSHLPLKDPSDIPDPYVKVKLLSNGQSNGPTYRTKVKMDCCNPVYEETFEYLCSKPDVYEQTLLFQVKTKKFFNDNTMGQVEIILKYVNLNEPYRMWFDLCPK